jgi:hypothetical protein
MALGLATAVGCGDLQVVTNSYATLEEARAAGAVERGWIPSFLPPSAYEIREAHDREGSRRRWGLFSFGDEGSEPLRRVLGPEISFEGVHADPPPRIEWWPLLLRGPLDSAQVDATGLKGYNVAKDELLVAVNWNQRRAYYWSRP